MYGTYCRLNLHVLAEWQEVVRRANRKIKRRDARKAFYRQMLKYHRDAQSLYSKVMSGRVG